MSHSIDIFYKSYSKDFGLLHFSLESLKRNVTGYNNVVVLIPEKEKELFDTSNLPERTLVYYVKEYGQGYLYQQVCKLQAYNYCFAEFIMFSDSDVIFDHKIDLQDFVTDGKPEILYTDYGKVGDAICWKKPTTDMIGEEMIFEFMRRFPLIYYRSTLENIAKWKPDLENIIMTSSRFSEFNLIGAYSFKFEPHNYTLINTDNWTYTEPAVSQVWSHSSKEEGADELHLRELIRTYETIAKAFGLDFSKL